MASSTDGSHPGETFKEFKDSFSYGLRGDTFFKFLKGLSEEDAARFLQESFRLIGDLADSGDPLPLIERVYEAQTLSYSPLDPPEFRWTYEDSPFTPLTKPVSEARVALFASSGHFVEGHDPEPFGIKNMTQEEAERRIGDFPKIPIDLSEIPADTPDEKLVVRQGGYDIRAALRDPSTVFPLARMRELADEGVIGEFAAVAYSFQGNSSQHRLLKEAGPEWVKLLQSRGVDAVLAVPI